ncbi:PREDICTED: uncharacterized protein LOC108373674 [Rhagoletis zephyria]|uniref:uncharacterized protein LOC108373674 n=1 Tax=Rhagoletis zephyria TaxID=28612 RepID=UPI0008117EED|nr:PREDICTED: uncharacterized protein LOC108373674 [Rhagoletis zephyria]
MLDSVNETNTMLATTFDTAVATAKSAAEDANKTAFITASPTTNSSPTKAKTFFSWFRGGNAKSPNKTDADANATTVKGVQTHKDCRVKGEEAFQARGNAKQLPTEPPQPSAAERDVTLREFRGVQSLRHLWNKRISASEDATRRQNSLSTSKASKLTKSIGCLVSAARAQAEATQSTSGSEGEALRQKRAHSLHDCTQVGVQAEEAVTTTAAEESEIDCFHREKDNFYKYKTAEQAAKHLARESRVRTKMTRRVTAGIVSSEARDEDAHFPAVKASERGERIHWLKRQDMVSRRRENTEMTVAHTPIGREKSTAAALALSADDIVISETANNAMMAITTAPTASAQRRNCPADFSDNNMLAASNSPRNLASRKRNSQREATNTSLAKRSSTDSNKSNSQSLSASGSLTSGTNTGGRSVRRTASSSSTSSASARKYSFKTHTRTYHAPRKMSQRDSGTVGSGGSGGGSNASAIVPGGGNIVAKLTQQFNEMIQKDKKLLEEVKRKNGVLLSRGGHVYKVVENPIAAAMEGGSKRSTLSRNMARAQDIATLRASTVQRNIIKFEGGPELDKPAVPAKSAQVLQKLRELNKAQQHSNTGSKRLLLKLPTSAPPNELQLKLELKKAQLALPLSPPLEVVTEESKTPLEAYEKSITIGQLRGGHTDTHSTVDVTSAHIAENTYGSCDNGSVNYNGREGDKNAINEVDQRSEDDDQQQASTVASGSPNEAVSSSTATLLTVSNATAENIEAKNVDEQAVANEETNDIESNAICMTTTLPPTQAIAIKTEATKTIVECNASAELSIPTTVATLETSDSGGRTKTTDAIATLAIATPQTKSTKEAALNGNATTDPRPTAIDSNDDQLDAANEEKAKQRKRKYAKIYEKFRFRSPFVGGHSNKKLSSKQAVSVAEVNNEFKRPAIELAEDAVKTIEIPTTPQTNTSTSTPTSTTPALATPTSTITKATDNKTEGGCISNADTTPEPESRLLDALEIIDHKLQDLTVDTDEENTAALLLSPDDDFEQRVLPNNSFVFQASTKQVANNKLIVAQAVNVTLVNSIEGEQLMLEQKELQREQCDYSELVRPLSLQLEQPVLVALEEDNRGEQTESAEPMYEPIAAQTEGTNAEEHLSATELPSAKSFLYTSCAAGTEKKLSDTDETLMEDPTSLVSSVENSDIFEDIYQTVDEAKAAAEQKVAEATNAALLADYESIAGSYEHTTPATIGVSPTHAGKPLYDGYEICEPPPDTPHMLANTTLTNADATGSSVIPKLTQQISMGGSNVRNTNDELPELPKPKRRLPKSPMPGKRSPKSTAKTSSSIREIVRTASSRGCSKSSSNSTITALDDQDDDHHYYADDENIYDTIKGSHCYESLHAASIALQKSASAVTKCGSDNISLTSNCYESISHYRRASHSNGGGSHLTGSSSGSTLTISSDHKTNSLYEMSVTASLIYGTGSVGSRQSVAEKTNAIISGRIGGTHNSVSDENSDVPAGAKSYSQSHGGATSDNSDEWVDISDPEAEGADKLVKQQFIVVRERSKAHRSPDWSKRVRDKRLHQKKAISCIEGELITIVIS